MQIHQTCSDVSEPPQWRQLKRPMGFPFIDADDGFYKDRCCYTSERSHCSAPASLHCRLVTCSSWRAASSLETLPRLILQPCEIKGRPGFPDSQVMWSNGAYQPQPPPCRRCTWPSPKETGLLSMIPPRICQETSNPRGYVNHHTRELLYVWVHFFFLGKVACNQRLNWVLSNQWLHLI